MSLFDTTWAIQVEKLLPPVLRDGDFVVLDNDFKAGNPENQYIQYILFSSPGHWKEFPLRGVGIFNYLQGTQSRQVLERNIRVQLESDKFFKRPYVSVQNFNTIIVNSVVVKAE